ncbi:Vesicle transport through interaction with t-SNAREs-like protein 1A [Acropora cervicornis]|uniref:Vesicle transport through interaction with t-SNAREs-like protein 1A n=1 Tax=Acropora cervicornis TaxID=6130 RepID=A0AAD9QAK1_ACRCE|nr:Vesicle transport through interaction with t-SNAREs-like protein 1A [Acropora cervicornis]
MADLFSHYEQQFGNLSAEITARICKIPNLHGTSKKAAISDVERCFDEARELVEQMELEKKARIAFSDQEGRNELLGGEDSQSSEDQRTRLLDNTERLERTGNHLEEGYKICVETGKGIYCHRHLFMSTILLDKEL